MWHHQNGFFVVLRSYATSSKSLFLSVRSRTPVHFSVQSCSSKFISEILFQFSSYFQIKKFRSKILLVHFIRQVLQKYFYQHIRGAARQSLLSY